MSGYLKVLRDHGLIGLRYGEIRLENVRAWLVYLNRYRQEKSLADIDGIVEIAVKIALMENDDQFRSEYKTTFTGEFFGF